LKNYSRKEKNDGFLQINFPNIKPETKNFRKNVSENCFRKGNIAQVRKNLAIFTAILGDFCKDEIVHFREME
jgi:hypothetical protein